MDGHGANGYRSAMVASEPITKEIWEEVSERTVVIIDENAVLTTHPIL